MKHGNILISITTAILLTAYASAASAQSGKPPLNLIPMYGYPDAVKTEAQKKVDENFIDTVSRSEGSREKASKGFAGEGWRYFSKGDVANAMRRFNQSWLLNPNSYHPYWGFGVLLQRKPSEAIIHYEKALSLVDDEGEKPRLLSDASRAYSAKGASATDKTEAKEFFGKANALLDEATKLNPKYGNAYRNWAISLYYEGDYEKAWEMVKKSRGLDGEELSPGFIEMLSKKMPEER